MGLVAAAAVACVLVAWPGDWGAEGVVVDEDALAESVRQAQLLDGLAADRPALLGLGRTRTGSADGGPSDGVLVAGMEEATTSAASAKSAVVFRGRVVDAEGRSVAGATISIAGPDGIVSVEADEDGNFSMHLPPGAWPALFRHGDGGALYLPSLVVDGRSAIAQDFTLRPTVRVEARVTDVEGPLAGIRVLTALDEGSAAATLFSNWPLAERSTDFDGKAFFDLVPQARYAFRAQIPDYMEIVAREVVKGDTTIRFHVPPRARLLGTVSQGVADGPGVGGARISLTIRPNASMGETTVELASAPDGTIDAEIPLGRLLSVLVEADGYAAWPAPNRAEATLKEVGRVRTIQPQGAATRLQDRRYEQVLRAVLLAGGSIYGRLLDDQGLGVGGVSIEARPRRTPVHTVTTGWSTEDGSYSIDNLGAGSYELAIGTAGVLPLDGQRMIVQVAGAGRGPVRHDIRVQRARTIAGVVLLRGGGPAAGAHVWILGGGVALRSMRQAGLPLEAYADAGGAFAIQDVPFDRAITVRARLGTLEATPARVAAGESSPLILQVDDTVILRGTVVETGDGRAVHGARVQVRPAGASRGRTNHHATTNAEGVWIVEGMLPGAWSVLPVATGYLQAAPTKVELEPASGERVVALSLDAGLVLSGWVESGSRVRLRNARVSASEDVDQGPRAAGPVTRTDASGRFRITGLARDKTWRLTAALGGYRANSLGGWRRPDDGIVLVLESLSAN